MPVETAKEAVGLVPMIADWGHYIGLGLIGGIGWIATRVENTYKKTVTRLDILEKEKFDRETFEQFTQHDRKIHAELQDSMNRVAQDVAVIKETLSWIKGTHSSH